ncbi:MAG: hypothetical protein JSR48_06480 [Verrucomicrobia bacterium]|nr:hypothetical protein [Verrucomicrobiota bacterium]
MAETTGAGQLPRIERVRGTAGWYSLGRTSGGAWWLLDPEGTPMFFRGVNEVTGSEDSPHAPGARLRSWGFAGLGPGSAAPVLEEGLPYVATVDFEGAGATIHSGDVRLPDVYDPAWPAAAALRAGERCLPLVERRDLVGWITDDRPGWAHPGHAGRPSLLQVCLSLEPSFAAYHAAWEFVLALHGGRLDAVARAWGTPLANKEVVRDRTRHEQGIATRGYLRDDARWAREFARRYFTLTSAAIRAHDPHHLVFGCRFGGRAGAAVLLECTHPAVDAAWIDLDDVAVAPAGPVFAGDFTWVDPRFLGAPGARRARGLTSVERMLRRGRTVLERAARHPAVVGFAWSRWRDRAGEQPPFAGGLVHGDDAEAREHTELLTDLNTRLEALRRGIG